MPGREQLGVRADQHVLANFQPALARQIGADVDDGTCANANTHAGVGRHIAQHQPRLGIEADRVGELDHIAAFAKAHDGDGWIDPTAGTKLVYAGKGGGGIRNAQQHPACSPGFFASSASHEPAQMAQPGPIEQQLAQSLHFRLKQHRLLVQAGDIALQLLNDFLRLGKRLLVLEQ